MDPKLAAFIEAVPAGALVVDGQGKIIACNNQLGETFGYGPGELLGESLERLLPADRREEHRRVRGEGQRARPMDPARSFAGVKKDGTPLELQVGLQRLHAEDEGLTMAVIVDVTATRRLERDLRSSKEAAERANVARSEFLATLSHEIRTPLHAIVGTTGLLLEAPLERNERELAETIQQACDSMLTLVSDILDFSQVESGELKLEPSDFELPPLIDEVLEQVAARAQGRTLDLSGFVPRHLPSVVRGDPARLRQVLLHLLTLAIKFAERSEITVEVRRVDGPGLRLRFEILDSGTGLTQSAARHINGAFGGGAKASAGTTLGIDLCRQVVAMMDGQLGVESVPGRGSRYWFEVKLENPTPTTRRPQPIPDLGDVRVLLVDDHPQARRALSHVLASAGAEVEVAAGGQEALARYAKRNHQEAPLNLVLTSARLPDMDAVTLARNLEARGPAHRPPIVRLVQGVGERLAPAEQALFLSDLKKPVRRELLFKAVLEALGRRSERPRLDPRHQRSRERKEIFILIAEDNPVSQRVAARMVESLGYSVEVVEDGNQAVARTAQKHFDLVLMDVQMPDLDGLAATKEIRRREAKTKSPRLKVVAMTASAWTGDRERCLAAGMDDYLSKPVEPRELDETLRRWLGEGSLPLAPAIRSVDPPTRAT